MAGDNKVPAVPVSFPCLQGGLGSAIESQLTALACIMPLAVAVPESRTEGERPDWGNGDLAFMMTADLGPSGLKAESLVSRL